MIFLLQNVQGEYREKMHEALLQLQKLINRPRFYYKNGFKRF